MLKMFDKIKFVWSKTNRWHKGLLILLLVELRLLPANQLGFKCNDPALSHPFTGDTISWKALLATTVLLPLVIMLIVERKYRSDMSVKSKQQALCWYKEYFFGLLSNLVIIQVLKLIAGSPRPHFFDTCSPKEALTCKGSEYVPSYTCTKAYWLNQSDRSFPSGHTSLAFYTGLFLAYYLHRRIGSSIKVRMLQALCVTMALFCSVSRVTDRRHHWWDVLAGFGIAVTLLLYTIISLCGNFECPNVSEDGIHMENASNETNNSTDTILIEAKET